MGEHIILGCTDCRHEIHVYGGIEFYLSSDGVEKGYGHPFPSSDEARRSGIAGHWWDMVCMECGHFQRLSYHTGRERPEMVCERCGNDNDSEFFWGGTLWGQERPERWTCRGRMATLEYRRAGMIRGLAVDLAVCLRRVSVPRVQLWPWDDWHEAIRVRVEGVGEIMSYPPIAEALEALGEKEILEEGTRSWSIFTWGKQRMLRRWRHTLGKLQEVENQIQELRLHPVDDANAIRIPCQHCREGVMFFNQLLTIM